MYFFIALLAALTPSALAAGLEHVGENAPGVSDMWDRIMQAFPNSGLGANAPQHVANTVIFFLLDLIGGMAVIMLVYAGIKIITSGGNEEGVSQAKKIAAYALGGLVLALAADAILRYAELLIRTGLGG